ncbi:hypothetical protein BDY21DRAFT_117622 [Lineolata rhizophorae]|uniref:Uncharacterized protein n=1 Tax=Lineolata rhizophorae TaxID=578093 RepID=A0A6A6NPL8_9PEZI|nr:hypothetical protein BDY21DRAFT_117622 [Lineolata rhizophorae]
MGKPAQVAETSHHLVEFLSSVLRRYRTASRLLSRKHKHGEVVWCCSSQRHSCPSVSKYHPVTSLAYDTHLDTQLQESHARQTTILNTTLFPYSTRRPISHLRRHRDQQRIFFLAVSRPRPHLIGI